METATTQDYIPVLSIAGSDTSGGAGIQQDIKTCEAFGCYGMAAITALTAQSPTHVSSVFNTSHFLKAQLETLLYVVCPFAVKTGILPDEESIRITAETIVRYHLRNVVVDPVIASTSGHTLTYGNAIAAMKESLFRLATIITPNIPEAEILTRRKISDIDDAQITAKMLSVRFGCDAVLIKGGHAGYGSDILYVAASDFFHIFPTERIDTPNTHGTGCRLSTAIACALALQDAEPDIPEAVRTAKEWLTQELRENAHMRLPL
ncbi:MAG: bifunctional hydroxymethylpyrimidine kinase/phosphomethylpyrimidine kinase [Muribaculaceae bacterium]|nr:bifunctional hydroxymethylpyrimidine kinase/phosphomethylpyrimidine kinase [Muribaculaceae bacterium]